MKIGRMLKESLSIAMPGSIIVHGPRRRHHSSAAITFDDGPHPKHTELILDILDEKDARATFFLTGAEVIKYPALARAIRDRGHQVGSHGFRHRHVRDCSWREVVSDVMRAHDVLEDTLGTTVARDYRPPYGAVSPTTFLAIARRGFRFVFWSLDSLDYSISDAAELTDRTVRMVRSGDILLFHEDYEHTLNALPAILTSLLTKGFQLGTIEELACSGVAR